MEKKNKTGFYITLVIVGLGIAALVMNQLIIGIVLIVGGILAGSVVTKKP